MRPLFTLALLIAVAACDTAPRDETSDASSDPIEISVLNDGTIVVDDEEMTSAELSEALQDVEATTVVSITTERDVTVGMLQEVQETLLGSGVKRVVFQNEVE